MSTRDVPDEVCLGRVVACHGIKGGVKVRAQFPQAELLSSVKSVRISQSDRPDNRVEIKSISFNQGIYLLQLADIETRNDAEELIDAELYVAKSELDGLAENEWWESDLIGSEAFSTEGQKLGTVVSVESGMTTLLSIKRLNAKEEDDPVLVPFVKALIPTVDIPKRRIEIALLPGLFD